MNRKNPKIADLKYLPREIKNTIALLRNWIIEKFQPEMIILFGSFATKKYKWNSDIDLLIVADTGDNPHLESDIKDYVSDRLEKKQIARIFSPVVASPQELNDRLAVGQYFFSEIVDKGRMLYNTGRFSLAEMRMLAPEEFVALVEKDFKYWRNKAKGFLKTYNFHLPERDYCLAAFDLHQVTEFSCVMVELIFTRYVTKTHDLKELMRRFRQNVPEADGIFPKETAFQKQAFTP
jgi:predicted nucleotidyltransferase